MRLFKKNKKPDDVLINEVNKLNQSSAKTLTFFDNVDYSNQSPIVKISNLNRVFYHKNKKTFGIEDLNLILYKNQPTALIGANGAGKTTLIEMITKTNKPDSGKIEYFFDNEYRNVLENIGVQFQDSNYPKGILVKQVVEFVLNAYNSQTTKPELEELLNVFGINEFWNKSAASLSGGQSQRLNALLAIIHKPKLVILDELSTGLDLSIRTKIKNWIKNFIEVNKLSLLLVSHDLNELELLAERFVMMRKGKIVMDITKQNLVNRFGSLEKCINEMI